MIDLNRLPEPASDNLCIDVYRYIPSVIVATIMLCITVAALLTYTNLSEGAIYAITFIILFASFFTFISIVKKINSVVYNKYKNQYFKAVENISRQNPIINSELFENIQKYLEDTNDLYVYIGQKELSIKFKNQTADDFIYNYKDNGYKDIDPVVQGVLAQKIIEKLRFCTYNVYYGDYTHFPDDVVLYIKHNQSLKDWIK